MKLTRTFFFVVLFILAYQISHAAISSEPLFLVTGAEPNVLFSLSVETPMGGAAYNDQLDASTGCGGRVDEGGSVGICYFNTMPFLGLFDPRKCYSYNTSSGYFVPSGIANSTYECSGSFSGNFMNWATMTAMDIFVWSMTGGDRVVDSESVTVVQRTRKHNNDDWFPHKFVNQTRNVSPSTVTPWSDTSIFIMNSDSGSGNSFIPQVVFGTTRGGNERGIYNVRIKVCDSSSDYVLENNCKTYGEYSKPEGLVQENSDRMRYAVTSYTLDNSPSRGGGVLRSIMKYIGPLLPDGTVNSAAEYTVNGTLINDPDGLAGSGGVNHSGVINYLNMFSRYGYKEYDPVSELFYEGLRYFKNLDPTPEYSSGLTDDQKGGFPVISSWTDPFLHWCQRCFIVGINDANPWYDKKLPGTYFTSQEQGEIRLDLESDDWGEPSNADSSIDVKYWTNLVGELQGINDTVRCIGCTKNSCDWLANSKLIPALGEVAGTCPYPPKQNSYYIAGLAFYANTQDIRTDLEGKQTVSTFMVDTQEFSTEPLVGEMNMLWLAGKYGGFIDKNNSGTPDSVSEWDRDGDGIPDNYVLASNPAKLVDALNRSFQDVMERTASAASIATNTTRLGTGTLVYQAKFNSQDWSGQLVAYKVNPDGSIGDVAWDTDGVGSIPVHSARKIFTYNGTSGLEFTSSNWASLSLSQQTDLQAGGSVDDGKARLEWLRGDQSKERNNGGSFRNRIKLLGDIVNSDPAFVGVSNFGYDRLPSTVAGQSTYSDFRTATMSRKNMLYIGANDGMLHAFDAETGEEVFAYVPKSVFPSLASLTSPDYIHKYFVDGSPFIGDAYFVVDTVGSWRSILVGTTGAGARSVFALDVTDPTDFDASKVLWEFTDPDLGYPIGQPVVARMKTGQWAAIFGNGYESSNNRAFLFIVNVQTGALIAKIDTKAGTAAIKNGLATPALLADSNRTIEYAYAGDLLGNLWKFNLTDTNINNPGWDVAFKSGNTPEPLFKARNSVGAQPITAPLEIIRHGGHPLILFGTGKYFEVGDNIVGNTPPVQSFYGILDTGSRITVSDRSDANYPLQKQTIIHEAVEEFTKPDESVITRPIRVVSNNPVDYTTKRGWYLDLVSPSSDGNSLAKGERVVSTPLARHGRIIFTTLLPSADPCEYGGTSWFMEIDATTGGRLNYSVFDMNLDRNFTEDDYVEIDTSEYDAEGNKIMLPVPVSGFKSEEGIIKTPAIISAGEDLELKIYGGSSGTVTSFWEKGSDMAGRQSWRQLR